MLSRWSEPEASKFLDRYGPEWGADLALRTYSSRLLGCEPGLVLHGGGNTSVKTLHSDIFAEHIAALYVKASGLDLASIEPEGHSGLRLDYLLRMRSLEGLSDGAMVNALRTHLLDCHAGTPSIEALVHAFIPEKFIDHTHADLILALTNQRDGQERVQEALGPGVIVLDYVAPGFDLARAAGSAYDSHPGIQGMVWMHHGLVTWGATARESYDATIDLVSRAERYLCARTARSITVHGHASVATAQERWVHAAPVLRGLLAEPSGNADQPYRRVILQPLITDEVLEFVDSEHGKEVALTPPLTSDHLIRTKPLPLWVDHPIYEDTTALRRQVAGALEEYRGSYEAYVHRNMAQMPEGVCPFSPMPRTVLMPGLGAACAGPDATEAKITRDITAHTLAVKAQIAAMGVYAGLSERELFHMEYRTLQHAKLKSVASLPLASEVAVVTGAAGAIGSAIAEELLAQGCHVAVTDLPGSALENLAQELKASAPDRVVGVPMDVTDPSSVHLGFDTIVGTWGGIDLVIVNAGIALASPLDEIALETFRKLERVNVEGSLLVLAEAARHFRLQGTGGDVVLVSTKNVFSPGPRFGAYSATKAAAHQLARIASLEMAELGVRVNMVAPDAVFSHGTRRSGLWAEVGPDRMRARGLKEDQLEEYYQQRNLLKVKVTARHVARAVLFFAARRTPTTGATLPVDGGLPEATPR
jgi:rhamnose utilization protein RhaD (predicted bifunctional aldolase and dehydrogenase)/NAD(P)-dependent dehydrogenase (short-subunit alcohol dehydrogenase family)